MTLVAMIVVMILAPKASVTLSIKSGVILSAAKDLLLRLSRAQTKRAKTDPSLRSG
jgi:hypothetical protein